MCDGTLTCSRSNLGVRWIDSEKMNDGGCDFLKYLKIPTFCEIDRSGSLLEKE
jgi:hypothetical protein